MRDERKNMSFPTQPTGSKPSFQKRRANMKKSEQPGGTDAALAKTETEAEDGTRKPSARVTAATTEVVPTS